MKKKVQIITALAVLFCAFFCTPVYAASSYPQETGSGNINGVSYFWSVDYRGFETSVYDGDFMVLKPHVSMVDSNIGQNGNITNMGKVHMFIESATVYHVSMTIRNRTQKIAVANLNDFQLRANAVGFSKYPVGVCIRNSINADVYNVDLNDSSKNFYLNFRSIPPLTLQPDEQIDLQFDFVFVADYNNTSALTDAPYMGTSSEAVSGNLGFTLSSSPSSFSLYTIEEYSDTYESFWSYLIRALRSLSHHDEYEGTQQTSEAVSSGSSEVATTSDTIHASESQWYQQNSADIEATGLSNFQFSDNQISGLSGVRSDFGSLWSALGGWTLVYVFSLTLSLGIMILRHMPRKVSYNSGGGGKRVRHN